MCEFCTIKELITLLEEQIESKIDYRIFEVGDKLNVWDISFLRTLEGENCFLPLDTEYILVEKNTKYPIEYGINLDLILYSNENKFRASSKYCCIPGFKAFDFPEEKKVKISNLLLTLPDTTVLREVLSRR